MMGLQHRNNLLPFDDADKGSQEYAKGLEPSQRRAVLANITRKQKKRKKGQHRARMADGNLAHRRIAHQELHEA